MTDDYDLTAINKYSMAAIVNIAIDIKDVGGGDHEGDTDSRKAKEQFVWTHKKAEIGWCLGVHIVAALSNLIDPVELVEFKKSVISAVDDELDEIRSALDAIDNKEETDK